METAYSLSDIASIMNDGNGCGGSAWVLIILFALIFGINGNGFGMGRQGEFGQFATAASQSEILLGQQFQTLNQAVNQVGDGLCSSTYALNNAINGVNQNLGTAITSEGRALQNQLCAINSNIDNKFAALEKSNLEQKIAEQSQQINQLSMQQMFCGIPRISNYAYGVYPYATQGCGCGNNLI